MLKERVRSIPLLVGVALWIATLSLYLSTLAPTLTWGWDGKAVDGGEFLAAANTLGIPHPPGYPTYTLLLKAFATLVPIGDFAYRGNLLSAILASGSVVLVYWVTLRFCRSIRPEAPATLVTTGAALGGAVLATSPLFWSQAVVTEVYTLNALFAGALLAIATHLTLPGKQDLLPSATRWLALFGFLLGIGLGNHLTLLAVAVPLIIWLWSALGWRKLASPWMIAAFIVGIGIYAYLPIRAAQDPPISWGNADSLKGVAWMLTARPYQDYLFGVPPGTIPTRLVSWTELVFSQFNPLGLFLGLMAIGPLRTRLPGFFLPALGSIAVISVYSIFYNTVDFEVLMIPAFLLFTVWLGVGFFWISATWVRDFADTLTVLWKSGLRIHAFHQVLILGLLAFVLLPGIAVVLNYGSQNLRDDRTASESARGLMDTVPDGSVLVSTGEKDVFSLWYMRYVEMPGRDVAVIAAPLMQFDWYLSDVHRMYPDRIPAMTASDFPEAFGRIVQHNDGGARVFFTFRNTALLDSVDLRQVGEIYEASVR